MVRGGSRTFLIKIVNDAKRYSAAKNISWISAFPGNQHVMKQPPLVIDLDGTLLRSDLLIETALAFLRVHPLGIFRLARWWLQGKARLKHELAQATEIDVTVLPYHAGVLELIQQARERGRVIVLATASTQRLAQRVAAHVRLFDEVIASSATQNLTALIKRDALIARFGLQGFDYAGNARADLPVWRAARQAYLVAAPSAVVRQARKNGNVTAVLAAPIDTPGATWRTWRKALRLHQWLKNLLLFAPVLAAHRADEWPLLSAALLAFCAFGLCASSVYILNDLLDLSHDRRHPQKRHRPFASGCLSLQSGLRVFPLLLIAAFSLALSLLPLSFTAGLAGYYALTLAYSLWLKRRMVIDVMALAALYTLRIINGAVALDIALSFWLLLFSMFIFLSLALVKRFAELFQLRAGGDTDLARGRGYSADDLPMVAALGAAAGYLAVMVLALYINDAHTLLLYRQPQIIWLACPLLLTWISRVWMLAQRGAMDEDPLIFAVRDRVSLGIAALLALTFWAAR